LAALPEKKLQKPEMQKRGRRAGNSLKKREKHASLRADFPARRAVLQRGRKRKEKNTRRLEKRRVENPRGEVQIHLRKKLEKKKRKTTSP